MKETVQVPDDRVQVAGLKNPWPPDENVTFPPMAMGLPGPVSDTVAVQFMIEPWRVDGGEHDTDTETDRTVAVRTVPPELVR